MPENLQPETMSTWMRDVERRLRAMESRSVPVGMPLVPYDLSEAVTVTNTTAVTAQRVVVPYAGRGALRVGMVVAATGSANITLQSLDVPSYPTTSTWSFSGTATGLLTFNWDISDWVVIGAPLTIRVQALVTNGGDSMVVYPPLGFEADPALIGATSDGDPQFT